jgi:glyoxylase-like metal-dependent hydrolase (beta-lactamase superfamily II)
VYLESLEKVRALAPPQIAPGHGDVIDDPARVLDGYLRHRLEREAQVLAHLPARQDEGVTPEQLVAILYRDVPEKLHPVARYSVWAHLRKLAADGRAVGAEVDDLNAPWTLR